MNAITVVTPTLPERGALLASAIASVRAQMLAPAAHLIGVDWARRGPAAVRNDLMRAVTTDWVAFLDDDDELFPAHLRDLRLAAGTTADVVGSLFEVEGRDPGEIPHRCGPPSVEGNHLPVTVLARTAAVLEAGGFDPADRHEDWGLWLRMAARGAVFRCLHEPTWRYRFHGSNRTFEASA